MASQKPQPVLPLSETAKMDNAERQAKLDEMHSRVEGGVWRIENGEWIWVPMDKDGIPVLDQPPLPKKKDKK